MFLLTLYGVFYVLIHSLYTVIECMWTTYLYISQKVRFIYSRFRSVKGETNYIRKRLANISKKPNHLTVILGVEDHAYRDLANLIFWCLSTNIPFISFYDYKGSLKKQEEKLQAIVSTTKSSNDHIIWHSEAGIVHKNGFAGRTIHVKIITEEDGRQCIVNVAKQLALNQEKNVTIEKINNCLQKQFEFPDPDLGIVCGKILHILNYPPWQLRLTEFSRISSVSNITFSKFLEHLEKYSKCEQRVGI